MTKAGLRLAVVGATLVVVLGGGTAHATFPGENGRLAFGRWHEPEIALVTANPDGSGARRLTFAASFENPSWSADGRRIVYVRGATAFSGNVLGVMKADGSSRRRIPFDADAIYSPSFSPAGRRVIFTASRRAGEPVRVWSVRTDGSDRRLLVKHLPGSVSGGVFSPDGTSIAFSYSPPDADYSSIYTVRTDGTGLRRITGTNFRDGAPDWAPGSGRLVFNRMSKDFTKVNLMVVNRGGAKLRAITDVPRSTYADDPAWSPDGRWIVYHQLTERQVLRFIRPDGSGGRRAIYGTDYSIMPSWQARPR